MKKIILYAGIAATVLTSCNTEELVEVASGDAITFRSTMALSEASRGVETTTGSLQQFKVTALSNNSGTALFEEELFTRVSGGTEFKSTKSYLWHEGADLTFFAYGYTASNGGAINPEAEITLTSDQKTINLFSPEKEVNKQIDLVTAVQTATYEDNRTQAVELKFKHILSELQVLAKSDNQTYDFSIKALKFGNVLSIGDYNFDTNCWSEVKSPTTYEVRYDNKAITLNSEAQNISTTETNGHFIVLPQTLTTFGSTTEVFEASSTGRSMTRAQYVAVLLQITVKDTGLQVYPLGKEGEYAWAYIPVHTDNANKWEPGHRITYVLDFTNGAGYSDPDDPKDPVDEILDGEIKFTASVNEWTNGPQIEPDVVGPNTPVEPKPTE